MKGRTVVYVTNEMWEDLRVRLPADVVAEQAKRFLDVPKLGERVRPLSVAIRWGPYYGLDPLDFLRLAARHGLDW